MKSDLFARSGQARLRQGAYSGEIYRIGITGHPLGGLKSLELTLHI